MVQSQNSLSYRLNRYEIAVLWIIVTTMDCTVSNIIEDTGIAKSTVDKTLYLLSLRGIIEYGIKTKDRGKSILYVPSHRRSIEEGDEY